MNRIMNRLERHKENRGLMANLRCVLVENKRHRAWPALNRIGVAINDLELAYVAGLFATHPESIADGNLGTTCRAVAQRRDEKGNKDEKMTPIERRFLHLLSAEKGELLSRVRRMVLMAKAEGLPVNYEKLAEDLKYWNDRVKTDWAVAFWAQGSALISEEDE